MLLQPGAEQTAWPAPARAAPLQRPIHYPELAVARFASQQRAGIEYAAPASHSACTNCCCEAACGRTRSRDARSARVTAAWEDR